MTAPTTEEVRLWLEMAQDRYDELAQAGEDERRAAAVGERDSLRDVALPIAEHRDALAAEVARLEARLECGASPYGVHRCVHCDSEVT